MAFFCVLFSSYQIHFMYLSFAKFLFLEWRNEGWEVTLCVCVCTHACANTCATGVNPTLSSQTMTFFCQARRSCLWDTPLFLPGRTWWGVVFPRVSCVEAPGKHGQQSLEPARTEICRGLEPPLGLPFPGWPWTTEFQLLPLHVCIMHVCYFGLSLSPEVTPPVFRSQFYWSLDCPVPIFPQLSKVGS